MNYNKHTKYVQCIIFLVQSQKCLRELSIQFSRRVKEIKMLFKGVKGAFENVA